MQKKAARPKKQRKAVPARTQAGRKTVRKAVVKIAKNLIRRKPAEKKPVKGRPRGRPRKEKVTAGKQTTLETIPAVVKPIKRIKPLVPSVKPREQKVVVPAKPVQLAQPVSPAKQPVPAITALKPVEVTTASPTGDRPIRINFPCKTCRFAGKRPASDRKKNSVELSFCEKKKQFCALCFEVRDFPNPKCDLYEKKEL